MLRSRRLAATGLTLAAAALAPGAADAAWRWPVRGEVVRAFEFSPRAPFAAGQRRGIDIVARPGATVGAACGGRVTFAGRLPARRMRRERTWGVTVRCGRLAATHLGLGRVAVRRGARVAAGAPLGSAGRAGAVRLGARVAATRFGYLDPLSLLGAEPLPRGGPGPVGAAPRDRRPRPSPEPAPHAALPRPSPALARPRPAPLASPAAGDHDFPALGWAGLGLLAAGLPLGGLVRRSRRRARRRRARPAAAPR